MIKLDHIANVITWGIKKRKLVIEGLVILVNKCPLKACNHELKHSTSCVTNWLLYYIASLLSQVTMEIIMQFLLWKNGILSP